MPSTRPSNAKTKASSDFLFSEDIENLSALLNEQESLNPSGAKPKKTTKSKKSLRDKDAIVVFLGVENYWNFFGALFCYMHNMVSQ